MRSNSSNYILAIWRWLVNMQIGWFLLAVIVYTVVVYAAMR